jgi:hypothetical protein
MSEVAVVAAITGGASALTSGITAAVTYAVSRNSSTVELAKVRAENDRLQQSNREEERRNRQATYHQFIEAATKVAQILGFPTPTEVRAERCNEYNRLISGVLVFSPPAVRQGAIALNEVYEDFWPAFEEQENKYPEKKSEDWWRDATSGRLEEFQEKGSTLIELMHQDVTRGITSDDSTA